MSGHLVTRHEWDADDYVPHKVIVLMHPTVEQLRDWRADHYGDLNGDAVATTTYENGAIEIHLAADSLWLAVIAHEVTHWALFVYAETVLKQLPHATARAHIINHTETLAELVGNTTALLFGSLRATGYTLDPVT
ncbi:hypothetical protein [Rathayibacter sp. Leaf248]|uniref:hypothetical protein n=1 Tax=Rathayibacter sp. Leaf248 TaxID=2876555 RepID=UPI001E542F2F|nr:hypothetical protein [Rathayibacter sp. Leaf248]